ncbi:nucleotide exchange factor SIL1 [Anabrus simplex]|uniref:nucleotide exchange factor SIL1 n=1 Tax=Anabrus simplex TaxID=316456 RepID=UPI0034DD0317
MECSKNIVIVVIFILIFRFPVVYLKENSGRTENASISSRHSEKLSEFKATNEWQTVKKGQPIPKGLHVRVNLQTGETEAKLLSESKEKRTDVATLPDAKETDRDSYEAPPAEKVKESLLNLVNTEEYSVTDEDIKRVREKFQSYEELKDKFKELNLTVKTDLEVMNELLTRFKAKQAVREESTDDDVLAILTDLEYLVHQFDNAREFIRLGGFTDVILPILNATRFELRSGAAHLIGSAVQSNPKAQIAALESGSIGLLLRAVAFDVNPTVRARSLFALSCIVRNFPAAQDKLVKEGGLTVLAQLFESDGQEEQKLQIKVVTLLQDLILERQDATRMLREGSSSSEEELKEKIRQQEAVGLEKKLVEQGWCARISGVLTRQDINKGRTNRRDDLSSAVARDVPVRPEHDIVEKVIGTMVAVADLCSEEFKNDDKFMSILVDLRDWYKQLATREDLDRQSRIPEDTTDDQYYYYYSGLAKLLDKLAEKLKLQTVRDEL